MTKTQAQTPGALRAMVAAAKALGHPARLRIVAMLGSGPLCVCQLTAVLALAASTVSGHLAELRRAGLVTERKQGKWVEYALHTEGRAVSLIGPTLAGMADDRQARQDLAAVRRLRRVPLETLCLTGVTLRTAAGERRVGGRGRVSPRVAPRPPRH